MKDSSINRLRVLTLIMAGGEGSRMAPLTDNRAKPALPYAGIYKLIDFPLSNCVHSGLSDVWVIVQFQPHAISEHLANGRPWDLDRTYGGLKIMPPHQGGEGEGWHDGNASAIYRNRTFIRNFAPDLVMVLSADHIYKLDYRDVIEAHIDRGAEVTLVTSEVPLSRSSRFGNVIAGNDGKVRDFIYKPEKGVSETVTAEVFVYTTDVLLSMLEELADSTTADGEPALKDFGHALLPELVKRGKVYHYPLESYWRDVGTIGSYWLSHMDMLKTPVRLDLDEPHWPIRTYGIQRMPARIQAGATVEDSLISPGCIIHGTVINSVLAPGVVVEPGATVRESVLFENATVRADAMVERAIIDSDATIGKAAQVGAPGSARTEGDALDEEIAVVGQGVRVVGGATVRPGERVTSDRRK